MNAPFPQPETPSPALARRHEAEREARDRWHTKWARINSELQAELDEIDRRYWRGEFA